MAVRGNIKKKLPIKTGHLFILGAIVMSVITALLFKSMASDKPAVASQKTTTDDVVVATNFVSAGTALMSGDYKIVKWPRDYLPVGTYFTKKDDLTGRIAKSDLIPGEPIYKSRLAGDKSIGGLPVLIPPGMRAITVGVTEVKGVAGFIKPGTYVDLLVTFDQESGDGNGGPRKTQMTRTVLQNVKVLAAAQTMLESNDEVAEKPKALQDNHDNHDSAKSLEDQMNSRQQAKKDAEKEAKNVSSVTLALTPEQAEKLALAENMGDIRLSLRGEGDTKEAEVHGVTSVDFMGPSLSHVDIPNPIPSAPSPPAVNPAALAPPPASLPLTGNSVELIEGTTKSVVNF